MLKARSQDVPVRLFPPRTRFCGSPVGVCGFDARVYLVFQLELPRHLVYSKLYPRGREAKCRPQALF